MAKIKYTVSTHYPSTDTTVEKTFRKSSAAKAYLKGMQDVLHNVSVGYEEQTHYGYQVLAENLLSDWMENTIVKVNNLDTQEVQTFFVAVFIDEYSPANN